jgi:uncharacterized SAM-binding protein YcdF (DUF218 family)
MRPLKDGMKMRIAGVIVVLGSPNDTQGRLLSIALERCSQAFVEFRRNPGYAILPTGGWGAHFNTTDQAHGFYVKQELIARGIPEWAFLTIAESSNTIEDAALSRPILEAYPGIDLIVVTSDFHLARARYLFEREFPERRITFSPSATDLPPDVITRLKEHEHKALKRLNKNA